MGKKITLKKIEKETKKTLKVGFIVAGVVFAIILVMSFAFGIKVSFVLNDELTIQLTPQDASFTVDNGEVAEVEFTVGNNNFIQCKSECEFTLTDLESSKVIDTDNKVMNHNEEVEKRYLIAAPEKRHGQRIYSFNVKCNNIKSVICPTDEIPRYKSALITLDYELSENEGGLKDYLKVEIEKVLLDMRNSSSLQDSTEIILAKLPSGIEEKKEIELSIVQLRKRLSSLITDVVDLIDLWGDEDYFKLDDLFSGMDVNEAKSISELMIKVQSKIIALIRLRNSNIETLKGVNVIKPDLIDMASFYQKENNANNKQKLVELNSISSDVYGSYLAIRSNKPMLEKGISLGLDGIRLLNNKTDDFKRNQAYGLFLSEYGKKLVELKGGSVTKISDEFECEELNDTIIDIGLLNEESLKFGEDNYPETIGDDEFDSVLSAVIRGIEREALGKLRADVGVSLIDGKDIVISFIDSMLQIKPAMRIGVTSVSEDDLKKMAELSIGLHDNFYIDNCATSGNSSFVPNSAYSLIGINFSSLDSYKLDDSVPDIILNMSTSLPDNPAECCVFGKCNECIEDKGPYPVLFLHGHAVNKANTPEFAMYDFAKIQMKMQKDGYVNAGELDISVNPLNVIEGDWGRSGKPVTLRSSYYYIPYYNIVGRTVSLQKTERIENYAIRLREIVNLLKYRTGADKVNIVAHSMGGLVVRQYMDLFGTKDVNKLIMIGTPNHGVSGRVDTLCSLLGASKECDDLAQGSIFLSRLNAKKIPSDISVYMIRGVGCEMDNGAIGDGIVTNESAYLDGAKNFVVYGNCTDSLNTNLHTVMLDPYAYPKTYSLLLDALK